MWYENKNPKQTPLSKHARYYAGLEQRKEVSFRKRTPHKIYTGWAELKHPYI